MGRIKEKVARGEIVRLFGVGQLLSSKLIEIVGLHGGMDGLWIDAEHAGLTLREIELATLSARAAGLDCFVRLPATDYATIMRPLEAGAGGIMVSMVENAAHAEQAVQWAKFFPRGMRGVNGGNRDGDYGLKPVKKLVAEANDQVFLGIQIETPGALAEVESIARIPDIDLLFVGPADLSQIVGHPGEFEHPDCFKAIDRIAEACARAGKPWGIVPRGREYADRMASKGCIMFVLAMDTHVVHAGINVMKERYTGFFQTS